MNFMQHHKLTITTLTSVHIGSGEDYEPGNYIIDKGYLYYFDPALLAEHMGAKTRDNLLQIVDKHNLNESSLIALQNFFKNNIPLIKQCYQYKVSVASGIEEFYQQRLGKVVQHEGRGRDGRQRKVVNKLQIERAVQNYITGEYFISGSSLKGAIRTAIVNALKTKQSLSHAEQRDMKNRGKAKQMSQSVQSEALHYNSRDVTSDPMKYLKLSDAVFQTQNKNFALPQASINFCVNRKRKPSKKQSMAEQKGLYQILECIASDQYRAISGEIRLLTDKDNTLGKLGIDSIQTLAGYCNAYYLPQLKQELAELENIAVISRSWYQSMQDLLNNELGERLKQGKTFILRLGKHGGAVSKTLDGLRAINIPQQKRTAEEASTVWLAAKRIKDTTDLYPFGWVIVELEDNSDITALKDLLETRTEALRKRFAAEYQQQLQEQQEQEARRQKEEDEKQAAIAEAQVKQTELAQATEGLSELATAFATRKIEEQWETQKQVFITPGLIEDLLQQLENDPQPDAIQILKQLIDQHFRGLLQNPNATQGRMKKPKYKPRQQEIAKRLLVLLEKD